MRDDASAGLLALFRKTLDDPAVVAFLAGCPGHRAPKPREGRQYVTDHALGFQMIFSHPTGGYGHRTNARTRVLTTVFLKAVGVEQTVAGYPALPFGLSFADTRDVLCEKLGEPEKSGEGWDRWRAGDLSVHAGYAEGGGVRMFTLMTRESAP